MMMKTKVITLMSILMLCSPNYGQHHEDDYVDPTDLLNFDPVSVRMKTVGKRDTTGVCMKTSSKNSDAQCTEIEPSLTVVPFLREKDSHVVNSEHIAGKQSTDAATVQECPKVKHSLESSISLFRQYVNKLLHMLETKVGTASSPVEINLRLRVSYHDISKLRNFGKGDSDEIHDVHETLSSMLMYTSDTLQPEASIYWLEKKIGLSFAVLLQILIIITAVLMLLIVLLRINISKKLLSSILFVTFVVSVIFSWIEMYQKEVAGQEKILMTYTLSDHCPKMNELSLWNRIATYISSTLTFQNENCREYFQALLVNPFVKVSPIEAVAVAFVKAIIAPCGIIGDGIKAFFIGLLKDLPAQYQIVVISVFLVFVGLTLFFCSGYHLRIFGLVTLGPTQIQHNDERTAVTNQHHQENRAEYHNQRPYSLQQSGLHRQGVVSERHQRTVHVTPVDPPEGFCGNSCSKSVTEEAICYFNDSSKIEQTDRHMNIVSNNEYRTDDCEHAAAQVENMNSAADSCVSEQYLAYSKQDKDGNVNKDAEFISNKIKDLTFIDKSPQASEPKTHPTQAHNPDMHLADKMDSMNISADLDSKRHKLDASRKDVK